MLSDFQWDFQSDPNQTTMTTMLDFKSTAIQFLFPNHLTLEQSWPDFLPGERQKSEKARRADKFASKGFRGNFLRLFWNLNDAKFLFCVAIFESYEFLP